ncbi:MAG: DUF983 domain-containing protein [Acidimicrobiia bacterium]|nr:DUF983 domain-containing protein [Acidimicrobiia bacterium]
MCGQRRIFRKWFTMLERCPRCNLRFERIDGHLTGALGINTVVSIVVVLVVGVFGGVLTYPDLPLAPLVTSITLVAAVFPILFYPFSKTIWTAIDLRMRPLEPGETEPGFGDWMKAHPDS